MGKKKTYYCRFYKGDRVWIRDPYRSQMSEQPYRVLGVEINDGAMTFGSQKTDQLRICYMVQPDGYDLVSPIRVPDKCVFASVEEVRASLNENDDQDEDEDEPANWWK